MRIYVENKVGVAAAYEVTEDAVRRALGSRAGGATITVRVSDAPDHAALAQAEYFIGSGFDTRRVGEVGKKLKVIHCTSAGVERYLPLDWLPRGAVLRNSSGVHAEKGGAFGAMPVLMLNDQIPGHAMNQRAHRWNAALSTAITGKTVLTYGLGSLGEAIAARLKPFGVRIVGIRRQQVV